MNILKLIGNVNGGAVIKTIDELSVGDFIKVNQTDGPVIDRLNFSGKVVQLSRVDGRFEVHTMDGVIGIGIDMDDITIEIHKLKQRPNGWSEFVKSGKVKPVKESPQPTIHTKRSRVFDLVKDNPRKRFPGLLTSAKKSIGGDENTLSNYIKLAIAKLR